MSDHLETLEFMPKKIALQQQIHAIVFPLKESQWGAFDDPNHKDQVNLEWAQGSDYTKAELVLIGFGIGGNLPHGTCHEIAKAASDFMDVSDDIDEELGRWWGGEKNSKNKGAGYHIQRNNFSEVFAGMMQSSNVWIVCCSIVIAMEMPSCIPKLSELVTAAIESGYEEDCF